MIQTFQGTRLYPIIIISLWNHLRWSLQAQLSHYVHKMKTDQMTKPPSRPSSSQHSTSKYRQSPIRRGGSLFVVQSKVLNKHHRSRHALSTSHQAALSRRGARHKSQSSDRHPSMNQRITELSHRFSATRPPGPSGPRPRPSLRLSPRGNACHSPQRWHRSRCPRRE